MGLLDMLKSKGKTGAAPAPPADEARMAREALHRRDMPAAIIHIARALATDPNHEMWLLTLRQIVEQAPGGNVDSLFPPRAEPLSPGENAVRAWGYHASGRIDEALATLAQVHHSAPESPYLSQWGVGWLRQARPGDVAREALGGLLIAYLTPLPEHDLQFQQDREAVHELYDWCRIWARGRKDLDSQISFALSVLERKAGELRRAAQTANEAFAQEGDWLSAMALAAAQREREDWLGALGSLREAAALSREMPSIMMDLADLQLERGEYSAALANYEKVLMREANHPAATPAAEFCRYFTTRNPASWQKLTAMAQDRRFAARAWELLEREVPFVGSLPEPGDRCAQVLSKMIEDYRLSRIHVIPNGPMEFAVPCLEAPSNLLAVRTQTRQWGWKVAPMMRPAKIQKPDPRVPLSQDLKTVLWHFDPQTGAFPRAAQPKPEVQAEIARIANHSWNWAKDFRRGLVLAEKLGQDHLADLLGVAVYPPELPTGRWTALSWVPRVQITVCQTIAGFGRQGWEHTTRRRVLLDLVQGPPDWLTLAAAIALGQIAASFPAAEAEIHDVLRRVQKGLPTVGFEYVQRGMLRVLIELPHLKKSDQVRYEKRLAKLSA